MQSVLLLLSAPGYGSENAYTALRLGRALLDEPEVELSIYLVGDAVVSAKKGQATPRGYYSLEKMLMVFTQKGVSIGLCSTCMDARGIKDSDLVEGAHRGSMEELAGLVRKSHKVLTF